MLITILLWEGTQSHKTCIYHAQHNTKCDLIKEKEYKLCNQVLMNQTKDVTMMTLLYKNIQNTKKGNKVHNPNLWSQYIMLIKIPLV